MNITQEINQFSKDQDKPALLWLFSKYHLASEWYFVARCTLQRYGKMSYQVNRVWAPTAEGRVLYNHNTEL